MALLKQLAYYIVLPVVLSAAIWLAFNTDSSAMHCYSDFGNAENYLCRPKCPKGYFSLPYMDECHKLLTCSDIESNDLKIQEVIGGGAVKIVYKARWKSHTVVLNALATKNYKPDFKHGRMMLAQLQPSPYVTQLIGYCKDQFVTEYHQFQSADYLDEILSAPEYADYNSIATRFNLCVNYVEIINFLHNSPIGTRVMCDSNDINKTLNQFLVTDDFRLVVNDLDALPLVNRTLKTKIKCGHRELYGDFVAPEQLWPHDDKDFDDALMKGYNEKTDIWKIPDVCEHFLGTVLGSDPVRFRLFKIHQACKQKKAKDRPNATEILAEYKRVQEDFDLI